MGHVYDVIIIGAGPGGCAAARTLASAGFSVGLFDKAIFPRDKICGDALIPDAHQALKKLGLMERITNISCPAKGMRLTSFDGSNVLIRADSACVPRLKLDELLLDSTMEAGSEFLPGHEFVGISDESEENYHVVFYRSGNHVPARAHWVLLATGANVRPIQRAGLLLRAECRKFRDSPVCA